MSSYHVRESILQYGMDVIDPERERRMRERLRRQVEPRRLRRFWKEVREWRKHVGCVIKVQLAKQLFDSYIEDRDIQSNIWAFL